MNGTQRVRNVLLGKTVDRQPIHGWVKDGMSKPIIETFGSVEAFEDKYEFDMAHIFGGPVIYNRELLNKIKEEHGELTPDLLMDVDFFVDADNLEDYRPVKEGIEYHKKKGRFCYVQTPGFVEAFNHVFGIENHLMYLVLYPEEIIALYKRQCEWNLKFVEHVIDLGADCVHISDDWGAQNNLMFSPAMWREYVYPNMKRMVDYIHSRGVFASLHSDGCIIPVTEGIKELGFDMVHPWQESAGMSYDYYLENHADDFTILGGVCVQTVLGMLPREELEAEIRRVFQKLKGKRWICCTTHFVQSHCSIEDLIYAFDLIYQLARE